VRGNARRKKNYLVQFETFHRIAGKNEVPIVNRIEAATIEAYLFVWFRHVVVYSRTMSSGDSGQLLLVGVPGAELDASTAAFFRRLQPGGFILFGRNIQTPAQLRKLIDDLRDVSRVEPIITIDQEGGRVSRLKLIGNEPPNARQLRDKGDPALIRRHGDTTGRLRRLFGFNLDLCPVLDLSFDDEADNSLKGRCYGRTVQEVIANAEAFNSALRATGILSCGKHFPGYACAALDPHHELPVIERSREALEENELAVFREFVGKVDSMMVGHISISGLEAGNLPASLSPMLIRGLLREEMGFEGLVMTDDLDMGAILNHYGFEETMKLGIAAGNDLLMICHRIELAAQARSTLESLPATKLESALANVSKFKARLAPPEEFSEVAFHALDAEVWDLRVCTLGAERAAQRSPDDGKRSPVEIY
jgi:beta-N-acetylhexosaminidase